MFPLVCQGDGAAVDFLPALLGNVEATHGIASEIIPVAYEFQIGANRMLRLRR